MLIVTDVRDVLPPLSGADMDELRSSMDVSGVGTWRNAVSPEILDCAKQFVRSELTAHAHQYFSLHGKEWLEGNPLQAIGNSPALQKIVQYLGDHALGRAGVDMEMAASLRVLTGERGKKHSNLFHFDSYIVTVLVPLVIPSEIDEPHGDLIIYPNMRRVRLSSVLNIAEKLLIENRIACIFWSGASAQRWLNARTVEMTPGNIYIFWGMRSLHANRACNPRRVRSTALFHFCDPHRASVFKRLSARYHRFRERRL